MKNGTGRPDIKICREELEQMVKEIKETFAFGYLDQNKIFCSADLWNIQRRRKSTSSRRNYV